MTSNDSIYYIGDITINWMGNKSKKEFMFLGLIGVIADEIADDGLLEFYSENNYDSFKEYYRANYESDLGVKNVTLNLPHPDELKSYEIFKDPAKNQHYLEFTTTKGKRCYGQLCQVNEKKIYIKFNETIYVIARKKLGTIKTSSGELVNLESISNKKFEPINFNSYEIINL